MILRLVSLVVVGFLMAAPAAAQTFDSPQPLKQGDAFGDEVSVPERTILYFRGHGNWDTAFETLVDAFGSLNDYMRSKNIAAAGNPMTIYMQTSDAGFDFLAALPLAAEPKNPPNGDIGISKIPAGRALKFTHRGSYEALDTTYEAITNYLDQKQIEAKETFIESYVSGPLKAGDKNMTVEIYVPVK